MLIFSRSFIEERCYKRSKQELDPDFTSIYGDGIYVPKCTMQSRNSPLNDGDESPDEEDPEIINFQLPKSFAHLPISSTSCQCFDPECKIKRHLNYRRRQEEKMKKKKSICHKSQYEDIHKNHESLNEARSALIRIAGGPEAMRDIYQKCAEMCQTNPKVFDPKAEPSTILAQLCYRVPENQLAGMLGADDGASRDLEHRKKVLIGQINAFIQLFIENGHSDMIFERNIEGYNALELAGLTDKAEVVIYLIRLYQVFNRDVNEQNKHGHTALHILARKGDDCANTLDRVLRLKDDEGKRLFKLDVINHGQKTPLDVAMVCSEMFNTGSKRVVYKEVINIFHKVIEDEAEEMQKSDF